MPHIWTLNLASDLRLNVPADLDNPVTLTLLEYEDWPEPEHAFLRQLIQPDMRLLDADTGLGLDALAMARGLNGEGQNLTARPSRTMIGAADQQITLDALHMTVCCQC